MIGTIINIGAVLAGGIIGNLLGVRLPDRFKQIVVTGLGLFVLAYGLQMFLSTSNALVVLGGILTGALVGEWLKIEEGLQEIGKYLERRFIKPKDTDGTSGNSRFVRGFITASLVFCVGPMTILGSLQDGSAGDHSLLVVKSVLDGFGALAFASTLGIGVLFSVAVILLYQGGLSLLAVQLHSIITTSMMIEMTATGGLIMIGIAISSLLEIKNIRIGSFLPALITTPIIVYIVTLFNH
jgi:uncharacterized protein